MVSEIKQNKKSYCAIIYLTVCVSMCLVSQSCLTLCNPMDCSLPGSSVHGIFQAIVLEWIAISFSKESSRPRDQTQVSHIIDRHFTVCDLSQKAEKQYYPSLNVNVKSLSRVRLFVTPWTVAYQAPLSMGFSRQ